MKDGDENAYKAGFEVLRAALEAIVATASSALRDDSVAQIMLGAGTITSSCATALRKAEVKMIEERQKSAKNKQKQKKLDRAYSRPYINNSCSTRKKTSLISLIEVTNPG